MEFDINFINELEDILPSFREFFTIKYIRLLNDLYTLKNNVKDSKKQMIYQMCWDNEIENIIKEFKPYIKEDTNVKQLVMKRR